MIIHPYKLGSRGAKRLRTVMNEQAHRKVCWVLQRPPRKSACLVINWGSSEMKFPTGQHTIINDPVDTHVMSDKRSFFERVGHSQDFLSWTTDPTEAKSWDKVFARQLTQASGGRGIVVWEKDGDQPFPSAPLYTKHQPKTHEYRFHMARSLRGETFHPILIQRKVFVATPERPAPTDWNVRNHENGFVFHSQSDVTKLPMEASDVARRVMEEHFPDLHFCALDIVYHKTTNRAVVIEGNTAPGLENETVNTYARYFSELNEEYSQRKVRM